MTEEHSDILLQDIKTRLHNLKEFRELGIPLKKFKRDTTEIKIRLMKWIRYQRSQECSYQQIQQKLIAEGVLTLSGKVRWDTRTISKLEKGRW
ncbi:MAG: hypothetical protein BWK80_13435 [Desulfobacteraceae bacterium IS3]|nr:MAG: hypothetical protein BWK80_13435 [Desulfobacteraceae bacterium IS3]